MTDSSLRNDDFWGDQSNGMRGDCVTETSASFAVSKKDEFVITNEELCYFE